MNKFAQAAKNVGYTENGAETNVSSHSKLLDFFFKAPAARNMPEHELCAMFDDALAENQRLAFATLKWLRDIRGGAGERRAYRVIIKHLAENIGWGSPYYDDFRSLITTTPVYGRFDDVFSVLGTQHEDIAIATIFEGLHNTKLVGLAAKWMPRKGPIAARLSRAFQMTPRTWRKFVVERSNTVEQLMCARDWESIEFSKVPSVAFSRYRKAFQRHVPESFVNFVTRVERGEDKVNASAVFPHDIIRGFPSMGPDEVRAAQIQWNALPDFLGDNSILPVVDVSGSMLTPVSGSVTALDVAVGLGAYVSERLKGPFKNLVLSFSEDAYFHEMRYANIVSNLRAMMRMPWGMNTNIQAAIKAILQLAISRNVPAHDMPKMLLIISDMEFDYCTHGRNFDGFRAQYEAAGYEMPQVVFWNVNSRQRGNMPVTVDQTGTALVAGYSPSVVKSVLGGKVDPWEVFLATVDVPRYA